MDATRSTRKNTDEKRGRSARGAAPRGGREERASGEDGGASCSKQGVNSGNGRPNGASRARKDGRWDGARTTTAAPRAKQAHGSGATDNHWPPPVQQRSSATPGTPPRSRPRPGRGRARAPAARSGRRLPGGVREMRAQAREKANHGRACDEGVADQAGSAKGGGRARRGGRSAARNAVAGCAEGSGGSEQRREDARDAKGGRKLKRGRNGEAREKHGREVGGRSRASAARGGERVDEAVGEDGGEGSSRGGKSE